MYTPDFQKIGLFLRLATQRLGLGPPDVDLDSELSIQHPIHTFQVLTSIGCVEVGTTTSLDGRLIRVPVVDLIWKYDNFMLRFYSVRISSLAVEGLRQFYGWLEKRLTETEPRCYESLGLPAGLCKCMSINAVTVLTQSNRAVYDSRLRPTHTLRKRHYALDPKRPHLDRRRTR